MYLGLGLPVDPLLEFTSPQLPLPLGTSPEVISRTAGPSVVISEGIPPISMKWVDLNVSIYGRCLPQLQSSVGPSMLNPGANGKSQSPVYFK